MRVALTLAFLAVVFASGAAQDQTAPPLPAPVRFVEREMWIPAPQSFPNGLDSIEVYADRPGRHPLVVLTHGTSNDPEISMRTTPWPPLGQALGFARRGFVAIVVVRRGYGRSGGQMDSQLGNCHSTRGGSFEAAGEAS